MDLRNIYPRLFYLLDCIDLKIGFVCLEDYNAPQPCTASGYLHSILLIIGSR